jgi:hypothetical protein
MDLKLLQMRKEVSDGLIVDFLKNYLEEVRLARRGTLTIKLDLIG